MTSTVFRNASGLPNREQVTTARDMARLANALMRDFPHYYPVFSVQSYPYRGRPLANHNRMLASYAGADGLKTGYTNASGFNLVMSAMRDNRRLIGVVMGGNSAFQRDRLMADLMDHGFATAQAHAALGLDVAAHAVVGALYRRQLRPAWSSPSRARQPGRAPSPRRPRRRHAAAASHPRRQPAAAGCRRAGRPDARQLGDPGRLVQRFAGRPARARAGHVGPARLDPLARRGDRRRGADGATRPCIAPGSPTSRRQEAIDGCKQLEQRKIYCSALQVTRLEYAGRPLSARFSAADERPLVAALPERQIPRLAGRLEALLRPARTPTPSSSHPPSAP